MIKLTDISKYYKGNDTVALGLHRINLEFDIGDFVVITRDSILDTKKLTRLINSTPGTEVQLVIIKFSQANIATIFFFDMPSIL